jgi:hypothetical protein
MKKQIDFEEVNQMISDCDALMVSGPGYSNELLYACLDTDENEGNVIEIRGATQNEVTTFSGATHNVLVGDFNEIIFEPKNKADSGRNQSFEIRLLETKNISE